MKAQLATETPTHRHDAQTSASSRPLRRFAAGEISALPDERAVRIDVNGCFAGSLLALPDAPRELAVGWAFMHGFFDTSDELGQVTVSRDRVSIMVSSGEDVDRRRLEAVGWAEPASDAEPAFAPERPFLVCDDDLVDLIDATWHVFRKDGADDGYVHSAAATGDWVHCVGRDIRVEMAVAKILGWIVLEGRQGTVPVLAMAGIVRRRIVEAAARVGIEVIVTSAWPTADALRVALGRGITTIGQAVSATPGVLVDAGHIVFGAADNVPDGGLA